MVVNKIDIKALRYLKEHGTTNEGILYIEAGSRHYHPKNFTKRLKKMGFIESKLGEQEETLLILTEKGSKFLDEYQKKLQV